MIRHTKKRSRSDLWMIRSTKKSSRSHFSDTNRKYYIRKSDLEVILVIQTEDTMSEKAI